MREMRLNGEKPSSRLKTPPKNPIIVLTYSISLSFLAKISPPTIILLYKATAIKYEMMEKIEVAFLK
jgi:hypothetical protein